MQGYPVLNPLTDSLQCRGYIVYDNINPVEMHNRDHVDRYL